MCVLVVSWPLTQLFFFNPEYVRVCRVCLQSNVPMLTNRSVVVTDPFGTGSLGVLDPVLAAAGRWVPLGRGPVAP